MNFLAHFHLAGPNKALIAGGLEGDYYKGLLSGKLSPGIERGIKLHRANFDARIEHFWSSVTLYPENVRQERRSLFDDWLNHNPLYSPEEIRKFHRYGGTGDGVNDFVMNRDDIVKTLSISSVWLKDNQYVFNHVNLDDETASFTKIVDKRNSVAEQT